MYAGFEFSQLLESTVEVENKKNKPTIETLLK